MVYFSQADYQIPDLFNLFVGFEIMSIASYVLLTVKTGPGEVRATMSYVVINLVVISQVVNNRCWPFPGP